MTGKPAQFAFDVTVTSNAYVYVRVRLATDSPDEVEKEFDGAGSFTATGGVLADDSAGPCYRIEATAEEERPAQTHNGPPLVEGSVTMALSLSQP